MVGVVCGGVEGSGETMTEQTTGRGGRPAPVLTDEEYEACLRAAVEAEPDPPTVYWGDEVVFLLRLLDEARAKLGRPRCAEREAALENGDRTYYTGRPCRRGHISPRYAANCVCKMCEPRR